MGGRTVSKPGQSQRDGAQQGAAGGAARDLLIEDRGHVRLLTLNRPQRANALSPELMAAIAEAFVEAGADPEVRAIVVTGAGDRAFCGGFDLKARHEADQAGKPFVYLMSTRERFVFEVIYETYKPVIAAINGAAVAGGFELALACDWRIAAHEARVGLPEAGLGLLAAGGGTQRLTRLLGPGLARRLILGGETLTGEQALQLGLVQWSVPRAALQSAAQALAERAAQVPRYTLAENKRCIALAAAAPGEGYAAEIAATRRLYQNPETRRRVTAFLDRNAAPTKEQA